MALPPNEVTGGRSVVTPHSSGPPHLQRAHGSPDATLVTLLISQPHMIERLAPRHADDGHGRCKSCSSGGQTGRYRFPCSIKLALEEACRQLRAQTPRRSPVPTGASRREELGR
jgi:hypothetical protein